MAPMPKPHQPRPAFQPFDDNAIYRVDKETAELMSLTFRRLQWIIYNGGITYIQYPSGRRLRGCDINDWVAKRTRTAIPPADRVPDPMAVARGQASQRVQKARRDAALRDAKAARAKTRTTKPRTTKKGGR